MSPRITKKSRLAYSGTSEGDNVNTPATLEYPHRSQNSTGGSEIPFFSQTSNIGSVPKEELTHQPGSIMRVKLENFVTYDNCEFFPGPNMNMVIGPNGSGKSTIVCAIALGLGGAPNLLGRAKELSEFVKLGKERAHIEIELKDHPSATDKDRRLVIIRNIQRANNSTSWRINDKTATKNEVLSVIGSFNIQVENLCQFLPQDKVAEFAELSSTKLLLATQKAAGMQDMHEWHNDLISLRHQQKETLSSTESDTNLLASMEASNRNLEKEVEFFNQREAIEKKILLYKLRIPAARFDGAKKIYDKARARRTKALEARERLDEKIAPLKDAIKNEMNAVEVIEKEIQALNHKLKSLERKRETSDGKMESLTDEATEIKRNLNQAREEQEKKQQKIRKLEASIKQLQERVDAGGPSEKDTEALIDRINQLKPDIKAIEDEFTKLQTEQVNIQTMGPKLNGDIHNLEKQLNRLNDVKQQRVDFLSRYDKSTGVAMEWLSKNRNMFKEQVFNPLVLEINIKDMRYAQAVENCFNSRAIKTFLCQNREDYDTFSRELIDKRKIRINVMCLDPRPLSSFRSPMPLEQIRNWGFDDYVLNLIEGPPPVLVALCQMCNFHAIPVTLKDVNNSVVDESRVILRYITGKFKYTVQVADYGARKTTVETQSLAPVRFVQGGVDQDKRAELLNKRYELQQMLVENEELLKNFKKKENEIQSKRDVLKSKRDALFNEKRKINDEKTRFEKARLNLESLVNELEYTKQEDFDAKISQLEKDLIELGQKQNQYIGTTKEIIAELVHVRLEILQKRLVLLEAKSKKQYVERKKYETDGYITRIQDIYQETHKEAQRLKRVAEALFNKAQDALANIDKDVREELQTFGKDLSLKELEDGLATEEARMKYLPGVSEDTLREYRTRCKDIEKLRETLEKRVETQETISKEIDETFKEWEPRISKLVKTISTNFSKGFQEIGCTGEIELRRHEDFDQWGIDILVKFRETENLQVLSGQRQSGGEKSVSTIMYLMAIQELAQSPFRVVDEINQGMDPHNERMIHRQLVRVACRPGTAQYFLITPKLLSDLAYHPHMKVLCIFNGEWQPENFNVRKYVTSCMTVLPSKRAHVATQDYA